MKSHNLCSLWLYIKLSSGYSLITETTGGDLCQDSTRKPYEDFIDYRPNNASPFIFKSRLSQQNLVTLSHATAELSILILLRADHGSPPLSTFSGFD